MNREAFDILVSRLEDLGAPYSLPSDWVLCTDLDIFRDVPTITARRRWLCKAKKEANRKGRNVASDLSRLRKLTTAPATGEHQEELNKQVNAKHDERGVCLLIVAQLEK